MRETTWDAIVVGGGPAGTSAATTLALAGRKVALVERTRFPRYHIGESLLPHAWWTLQRMGVLDKVKAAGFQTKHGVRFVSPDGALSRPFWFDEHLDHHDCANTWQVERAQFDKLLLDHARTVGVTVFEDTRATDLVEHQDRVIGIDVTGPEGHARLRAPWTIDASGREGFVRTARGWRNPEHALDRISLWAYYRGVPMDEDLAHSTTVVQLPEDGWFWFIPLANGITSVGLVVRREVLFRTTRDLDDVWTQQLAQNPWLGATLAGAERISPVDATADYSYRSSFSADNGVVLAGDAFAFLDPVFSSGVFLALRTGEEAALGVHAALTAGTTDASAFAAYGEWACRGVEAMRALVFSFYDPKFSMGQMVKARPDLKGDVTDLLIGDLFRDYDKLQAALAQHGQVPEPLCHGRVRGAAA